MIKEGVIDTARSRSVVGYLIAFGAKGFQKGNRWTCPSPLRDETKASFSVSTDKNLWYDFGLGVGGDLIDLVMRIEGCSFKDAVQSIMSMDMKDMMEDHPSGGSSVAPASEPVSEVPPDLGQSKSGRRVVEKFFSMLGFPFYPEIEAFPMSYKHGNYIGFPCPTPAERLGVECRGFRMGNGGLVSSGRRMTLGKKLPWVFLRDSKRYLVTESITDSLAGEVILGDTSLSLVALNSVGLIKRLPEYIPSGSEVLIALDNDGEQNDHIGQVREAEAKELLLAHGCVVKHITHHKEAGVKDLYRLLLKSRK